MYHSPSIAVIVDSGLVKDIIVENWPGNTAIPRVAIADIATRYARGGDLLQIRIGDAVYAADGYQIVPKPYQPGRHLVSPSELIKALRDIDIAAIVTQVRYIARKYGLTLNDRNALDAVKASARRLFITLDEEILTEALNQLKQQDPDAPLLDRLPLIDD